MPHWIVKTEPESYSWDDLVAEAARDGDALWDGVRNHQAAANLRAMAVDDEVAVYHSVSDKAAVGVARVTRAAFPDPTDEAGKWVAVRLAPVRRLARPVTLKAMKADATLAAMPLVRQSRLSVAPVENAQWRALLAMAGA